MEIIACGETQGFYGNSIIPATRFFTPAATTLEETKRIIDKSWEIRNSYKRLEYKQKGKKR